MGTTAKDEAAPSPTGPGPVVATLKLPVFWQSDSELWFLTVEPLFRRHRVTSQTARYDYAIGALPPSVIAIVKDILRSTPLDTPYDALKAELIRRTTESEQCRLQQLLSEEELGDRKATELLRRMRYLTGDHSAALDACILRELVLQLLPEHVRINLSVSSTKTPDSLAQMAGKIMDVSNPAISGIERLRDSSLFAPVPGDRLDRLLQANEELNRKVDQLVAELSSLKGDHRRNASQLHQSRNRSSSVPRSACWYHRRYGARARQCNQPCQFAGKCTGHALTVASVSGPTYSRLFHVTDRVTKVRYLIDTGAEVRVVPPKLEDRQRSQTMPPVTAVNGSTIRVLWT